PSELLVSSSSEESEPGDVAKGEEDDKQSEAVEADIVFEDTDVELEQALAGPANRTADGEPPLKRFKPKKADFRQRAHCNPLSDPLMVYPVSPRHVDWSMHFP
ncbi:tRNA (guanine-N(7)-)-methyltransferase, partial [Perkinsus olseni]